MRSMCSSFFLAATLLFSSAAQALPVNGNFEAGLSQWTTSGAVSTQPQGLANNVAQLSDANGYSRLFTSAGLAVGQEYVFEFDFASELSQYVDLGTFADAFFATLFFVDDLGTFDLDTAQYDYAQNILDAEFSSQNIYSGTVSASALGGGWSHYSFTFLNAYAFAIPAFELFDLNGVSNDSRFLIDNVSFTATEVPEPATLLLLGAGLGGIARMKRKKC